MSKKRVGLAETGGGPDLVKSIVHFEPGEALLPHQIAVQIGQIESLTPLPGVHGAGINDAETIVYVQHRGGAVNFVVTADYAVDKFDIAGVPAPGVLEHGHHRWQLRSFESPQNRPKRRRKVAISIHYEELARQPA